MIIILYLTQISSQIILYPHYKLENLYKLNNTENYKENNINETNTENKENDIWTIEIPKINLNAQIADGTDSENLNKYVGHFTESGYSNGNICLAAHNRGYKVNYFSNIKSLQNGDEIIYKYKNIKLVYAVEKNIVINDTDVHVIENTKEDKITLITCVENQPNKRRCIEGKLKI